MGEIMAALATTHAPQLLIRPRDTEDAHVRAEADLRKRYLRDPKTVVTEAGLSAAEGQAVLARDVPGLVAVGAHPLLAILLRIFADMDERPDNYERY